MARKKKKGKKNSSASNAKRRAAEHKTGFVSTTIKLPEGVEFIKLKTGKPMRVDILNYKVGKGNPWADEGSLHYERTFFVHKGIGVDNNAYVCPAKTAGKKCPICEHRARLSNQDEPSESTQDLIKSLKPKEQQLFNIIDRKADEQKVSLLAISNWLFGKFLDGTINDIEDDDDDYSSFADLQDGFFLKLGVDEKSFAGKKYYEIPRVSFKARKEDYEDDFMDELHCLDDLLIILSYKELKSIFLQTEDLDDDDDDDDEPKSKKKKSKKKSSKKKKDEDEDDDEDFEDEDFDEDEDDEEDSEDDEDDEDADDEDDDEEDSESDDDDEDEEDEDDDEFDDDEESESEEEDDEEDEDEEDDDIPFDDDDDFEDDDEEDEKPKKSKKKSSKKKTTKKKTSKKKTTKKKSTKLKDKKKSKKKKKK